MSYVNLMMLSGTTPRYNGNKKTKQETGEPDSENEVDLQDLKGFLNLE